MTDRAGSAMRNLGRSAPAPGIMEGASASERPAPAAFDKYAARPNSFYNNDAIDRAAKAILPLLDEFMQSKGVSERAACLVAVTRVRHKYPELKR